MEGQMFAFAFALALASSPSGDPKSVIVHQTSEQVAETTAREQLTRKCQKGPADYCYALGRLFKLGLGGPADPEGARELFERACHGHVTNACLELNPHFMDADLRNSAELGCREGQQSFCVDLASMLWRGVGGPADIPRAKGLLEEACRKGYAPACTPAKR
jgi:TPR repeat protein